MTNETATEGNERLRAILDHVPGYALSSTYHNGVVACKCGKPWCLSISRSTDYRHKGDKARLVIRGWWPKSVTGGYMSAQSWGAIGFDETEPEITVLASKSPRVIGRDIQRRFLPTFEPIAERVHAACKSESEAYDTMYATAERFERLGCRVWQHPASTVAQCRARRLDNITFRVSMNDKDNSTLRFTVGFGGSISVERTYLSVKTVEAIVAVFAGERLK